ncbi:hypothetical protein D9M68_578320 [compost metagenome]
MAEGGFGQKDPGQEGAHGHGQAAKLHQQGRPQHHQQRGRGHDLAGVRRSQQPEQRVEQPPARRQQGQDAAHRNGRLQPRIAVFGAAGRRQQAGQRQQGDDGQILQQEDRHDALPLRAGGLAPFGENLHDDRGGRQHKPHRRHEGRWSGQPGQQADARQERPAGDHLRDAQAEDLATQLPQPGRLHFQANDEKKHHYAQFGDVQDGLGIGKKPHAERADG